MANKNHDPRTGKFTSAGGLNKANSTAGERIRGVAKDAAITAGRFGKDLAAGVVESAVQGVYAGVSHTFKRHAVGVAGRFINYAYPGIEAAAVSGSTRAAQATADAAVSAAKGASAGFGYARTKVGEHAAALKKHLTKESQPAKKSPMWQHQDGQSTDSKPHGSGLWQHQESDVTRTPSSPLPVKKSSTKQASTPKRRPRK